ncbi:hypothetical protein [Aeribacillus sp. FSL K6-2848]|uniref:hypothetical protein n=1 Tax=Aeribacillus sp. FSL K6-2848 TaxID=2954612 RepID=UPI0040402324
MAIIPQLSLFSWNEIEELGDLERLRLVLENMPDEAFMKKLEKERGKGRDEYPVRAMWNALLAGIVFQHERRPFPILLPMFLVWTSCKPLSRRPLPQKIRSRSSLT